MQATASMELDDSVRLKVDAFGVITRKKSKSLI
jgi:hypothetical protein